MWAPRSFQKARAGSFTEGQQNTSKFQAHGIIPGKHITWWVASMPKCNNSNAFGWNASLKKRLKINAQFFINRQAYFKLTHMNCICPKSFHQDF